MWLLNLTFPWHWVLDTHFSTSTLCHSRMLKEPEDASWEGTTATAPHQPLPSP